MELWSFEVLLGVGVGMLIVSLGMLIAVAMRSLFGDCK